MTRMRLKPAPRVVFGVGGLALIVTLTVVLVLDLGPREPQYHGVGLSAWLDGTMYATGASSSQVVESVGSEALPWLTHALEINDGKSFRNKVYQWYRRFYLESSAQRFLPKPPIPRWQIARHNALTVLARLAPGTPYERRVLNGILSTDADGDREFASIRLHSISRFTNFPDLVVPALLGGLTNPATFDVSVDGLRHFRASASAPLYNMAVKESGTIRPAELALEKVDPDAYHNLRAEKQRF